MKIYQKRQLTALNCPRLLQLKNTATFGKVANVYLQYYFELDGQILDLKADSTIFITKKVIKKGEKVEKIDLIIKTVP